MTTAKEKKEAAFSLYVEKVTAAEIAKAVEVHSRSVERWIQKDGWKRRAEKNRQIILEKGRNNQNKINLTLLDLAKKVYGMALQNGMVKVKLGDIKHIIEVERLLNNESTENVAVRAEVTMEEAYAKYLEKKKKKKELEAIEGTVEVVIPDLN